MDNIYKGYFKKRYGEISGRKVERQKKTFYTKFKLIKKMVNIRQEDKIFEIGSGFGALYSFLNSKNYLGLELDAEMVDFTNKFFKTNVFINKSFEEFETKEKFDKIFAFEVLEHLKDPISSIIKIKNLLNKDGIFIGTTPYPSRYSVVANETHLFVLHPENWKVHFLNCGFKKVKIYPMSFIPVLWRINRSINVILPFYLPLDYFICTSLIVAKK